MLTAVVGINWGDEGKGRMVDLLSADYDIVCRYQGGNNAGHTVINDYGKIVLNLLPSGISREGTVNVMGNGMVIDLEHLVHEIQSLRDKGIHIGPDNLKISDKAVICLPWHKMQDIMEEERLKDKKFGSTRRGIGPVYADKYMKKAIRMGDLFAPDKLPEKVADLTEWKNLTVRGYGHEPVKAEDILAWLHEFGDPIKPYITDVSDYLYDAATAGENIMFEAQLGALRDIEFGIYPYTSSSCTLAGYATIGAGIPGLKLDKTIGIMKAYSSCVGEGPFTVEMFGDETFTKSGSGYKWHFGKEELAMLLAEAIPGFIADSGVEELSIDLTMRSDGGVELKYTASTSVNEEAALRIDYTLAGNSSRMTAKGTVQVRNVCDVTFDAAVSVRTTSEKPLTAPPAGATIITLPPVMPIAA